MDNTNNHFHKLLEQYTFRIAGHFIEAATASTQTDLINFLYQIDTEDKPVGALGQASIGPDRRVEPVDPFSVDKPWLSSLMQARSRRYELYIRLLERVILQTETHLGQVERTPGREPYRTRSIDWYRSMLRAYKSQLIMTQKSHKASVNHLRQW